MQVDFDSVRGNDAQMQGCVSHGVACVVVGISNRAAVSVQGRCWKSRRKKRQGQYAWAVESFVLRTDGGAQCRAVEMAGGVRVNQRMCGTDQSDAM